MFRPQCSPAPALDLKRLNMRQQEPSIPVSVKPVVLLTSSIQSLGCYARAVEKAFLPTCLGVWQRGFHVGRSLERLVPESTPNPRFQLRSTVCGASLGVRTMSCQKGVAPDTKHSKAHAGLRADLLHTFFRRASTFARASYGQMPAALLLSAGSHPLHLNPYS